MRILRHRMDALPEPAEWFTGAVYTIDVTVPSANCSSQHIFQFTPAARSAWHSHPRGETIFVTEGIGFYQRRGGQVEVIASGDRVTFAPGEQHWHGAAPNRAMTHLSLLETDEGKARPTVWGGRVSDEEYFAAPDTDG